MTRLERALDAAEDRKQASLGNQSGLRFPNNELQERAIFSGFDIDYEELTFLAARVGSYFHNSAGNVGLRALFSAAWVDGLLIGLLAASLPDEEPSGQAMDGTCSEGDDDDEDFEP